MSQNPYGMRVRPGSDVALMNGLLAWCRNHGAIDEAYLAAHVAVPEDFLDKAGAGSDHVYGFGGADWLIGGSGEGNDFYDGGGGDDLAYGDAGDDTLYGDTGNDLLIGDTGNNVYYYGLNDGADIIAINQTASGVVQSDVLRLGAGLTAADFDVSNDLGDLVMRINSTFDSMRVLGLLSDPTTYNFSIKFIDGTTMDINAIQRMFQNVNDTYAGTAGNDFYTGGAGNDTINGAAGADTLYGDTGDDLIDGGAGADNILFGRGDGRDTLVANDANSVGDKVLLSRAIDVSDVNTSRVGNDLLLAVRDTTDTFLIQGYFSTAQANRPVVQFATGETWTGATIDRKLAAVSGTMLGKRKNSVHQWR